MSVNKIVTKIKINNPLDEVAIPTGCDDVIEKETQITADYLALLPTGETTSVLNF